MQRSCLVRAASLLLVASVSPAASPEAEPAGVGWHAEGRLGGVAAGGADAVLAGISILATGGNAADAAVATILALAVTDHGLFCFGAEVPFMICDARDGKVKVLSGMGGAPLDPGATRWYLEHGIPTAKDLKSAAVPAAPSVCFEALRRFGTVSFETAAAPALAILDRGKEPWHRDLAATLRRLIETERAAPGTREEKLQAARDRFYKGDIADELEAWYIANGSFLRKADLAAHETRLEGPVTASYRGYTVCKCGPWTQGPYLCQTLRLVEAFPMKELGNLSAEAIHVSAEALKLALADRDEWYGDPLFVSVPMRELLSDEYTRIRVPLIDRRAASPEIRPGDPLTMRAVKGRGESRPGPGGTTTCCVADRWGNVVAATPSGNPPYVEPYGGSTGVAHATRLTSLNTASDHPNSIAPGKRPRITLTPTIVLREGKPVLAVSVAGGDVQDQVTFQLLVDSIDHGMLPHEAVRLPRFSTGHHQSSFDPRPDRERSVVQPATVTLHAAIPDAVAADLQDRGHAIRRTPNPIGSPVLLSRDPETGLIRVAGDPAAGRHAAAIDSD